MLSENAIVNASWGKDVGNEWQRTKVKEREDVVEQVRRITNAGAKERDEKLDEESAVSDEEGNVSDGERRSSVIVSSEGEEDEREGFKEVGAKSVCAKEESASEDKNEQDSMNEGRVRVAVEKLEKRSQSAEKARREEGEIRENGEMRGYNSILGTPINTYTKEHTCNEEQTPSIWALPGPGTSADGEGGTTNPSTTTNISTSTPKSNAGQSNVAKTPHSQAQAIQTDTEHDTEEAAKTTQIQNLPAHKAIATKQTTLSLTPQPHCSMQINTDSADGGNAKAKGKAKGKSLKARSTKVNTRVQPSTSRPRRQAPSTGTHSNTDDKDKSK